MSSSDRTSIKKYNSMNNKFSSKSSSNETSKKKINVIRNIQNTDIFGIPIEKMWFNIPITNTNITVCANATIQSSIITTPIIEKIPNMTIPLAIKMRKIPTIISFSISNITTTQIELKYAGNYTYVDISRDGIQIATDIYASIYTDSSGLIENTYYTYIITPKQICNIVGKITCNTGIPITITQSTLPNIISFTISNTTVSQNILNYTGYYNKVSISRNGVVLASYISGTTYTDSGLSPNTSYTYIIIPYNSSNEAGITSTIIQKTLPNITSLSVFSKINSTIVLHYTGNYTYVNISRGGTPIATDISGTTYTDSSGLIENTYYTYVVTPYNSVGAGTSMSITQNTILNIISLTVSGITASQIILSYTGNYATINISRNGSNIATYTTGTTYTDTGLTGNTSYTYLVTPYDLSGNSGITSTITTKTLPNITSLSISEKTYSQIVLSIIGNYTNVSISRDGSNIETGLTTSTYTDSSGITGLSANTSYTYLVTPYDLSGNSGITTTITSKTLPNITSLSISSETASQIVLAITGIYTYVTIYRNESILASDFTENTYTDSYGLTSNTLYTYVVTPYDISGNSGVSSTISTPANAIITSLTLSSISMTQIVFDYSGHYSFVDITRNGTAIGIEISGTDTYTDSSGITGLTPNTTYTYLVTPYDISGNAGISASMTKITIPNITFLTTTNTSPTQIELVYSGNYAYVSIFKDGLAVVNDISGIMYIDSSGLTANTSHTYVVTPYNSNGLSGTSSTITEVTLPILTSLGIYSTTTSSIVLDYTGTYTDVSISRNGTAVIDSNELTSNTSYTYVVTPYNSASVAGSSLSITEVTLPIT